MASLPLSDQPSAPDDLSYEQARDELIAVVSELEQGSATLEHSLELWERGEALAKRCEHWLLGAKARLDAARGAGAESPAGSGSRSGSRSGSGSGSGSGMAE